jgi:hypothetical protein
LPGIEVLVLEMNGDGNTARVTPGHTDKIRTLEPTVRLVPATIKEPTG